MNDKLKTNKLLSPFITMLLLIAIISILSFIFEKISLEGSITSIVNGKLETSIVVVKNILSKDGLIYMLSNLTNNFNLLEQLVLIIISMFSISILDSSGILKHIFTPLKRIKSKYITFFVVFISVISTIILDYSYIILIPLISIVYKYLNKNPILGILTVFLGITLGYGTGIIYNYNDYSLGVLTELAATIDVDPTYKYSMYSNIYIMIISTILISFIITFLIEKNISKKITVFEHVEEDFKTSKKALISSLIAGFISIIIILIGILPNGLLLDNTQNIYIAKLFSNNAPFYLSFMYLVLFVFSIIGLVYGTISKNFSNNHEYSSGFTKEFNNVGYLFILLFLSSILMSIINWTNIGTVLIGKIMYLLELFDFTGIPLIVITFILICLMSIIIPSSIEKWILISPVLVPIFMRANITPDFLQFLFQIADSIGKCITPLFIYFIITLGFVQKYNKDNKISLFNTFKYTIPVVITVFVFWILLLVIWYISGLPLGVGTYATM
jgi:aminobenzoyl-glutamate transport protein